MTRATPQAAAPTPPTAASLLAEGGEGQPTISQTEARLLEAYGPLEMARVIESLCRELAWIEAFAQVRSKDDSKTFARVNRGALRNIAERAGRAIDQVSA